MAAGASIERMDDRMATNKRKQTSVCVSLWHVCVLVKLGGTSAPASLETGHIDGRH